MGQSTRDLPIEIAERPYVPVMVNDTGPHPFLLDTGALGLSLATDVAQALGLEVEDGWTTVRRLAIGSCRWPDVGLGVGDNSALSSLLGRPVAGIIGSRFLAAAKLSLTIDYPSQTLSLEEGAEGGGLPPSAVGLTIANGYPLVPGRPNGTGPYLFLLDTGAGPCLISPAVARSLDLPMGNRGTARGVADDLESCRSVLALLAVGDQCAADLEVGVMDCATISGYAGTQVDGYLGHGFLSRFAVSVDFPRRALSLQ